MGARIICVGDKNQSLYRFRGADCRAFQRIGEMLVDNGGKLATRELPINYRSDESIIKHAQQWVPNLKGNSKALGTVGSMVFSEAMERANNDGLDISLPDGINGSERSLTNVNFAFLCRINLPLIITAYQLIAQGKRCCIIGRQQIGAPLKNIIESICGTDRNQGGYVNRISDKLDSDGDIAEEGLMTRLNQYYRMQSAKLQGEGYEKKLETLKQNVECIEVIATRVKDDKVSSLLLEIDTLFVEDPTPGVISLSTIHRSKGLEWEVVFILRPDLLPHPAAKPNPDGSWSDEQQQEKNAQYVAATRAKNRLYYVANWPFGSSKSLSSDFEVEPVYNENQTEYSGTFDPLPQEDKPQFSDEQDPFEAGQAGAFDRIKKSSSKMEFFDDGEPF
jgi:hypothetical protein